MSTCTKISKKLEAGRSLAAAPFGPECDSTSPGLTRDGGCWILALSYQTPARTIGCGPPKLTIFKERTSVWIFRVLALEEHAPVAPWHGNPGGADSMASLTLVSAVPIWTPLVSAALPFSKALLRPTLVVGSYMVGLVRIGLFQPGQPANMLAN